MKVLAIERDDSACNYYRIMQPLFKMQQHGMAQVITIEEGPKLGLDIAQHKLLEADIVVVHRPASEEWYTFLKKCQKAGKIIVCDYDDDPFNTSPLNPYYQFIGVQEVKFQWPDGTTEMLWSRNPAESGGRYIDIDANIRRRDLFNMTFRKADMVTTTTDILRDKLSVLNKNTVALPNLVDFTAYPQVELVKKRIRIGYQGGSSHYEDLYLVADAIKRILKKYPQVDFVLMGELRFYGLFKDIPISRVECHPWVKHEMYPYKLALLNLDIGICPLVDNEFNRNKSAIKYFEYSIYKTATIASDIPPYSPVINNGIDGLLVKDDQWFDAIEELVLNEEKRNKLGSAAYENVYENYNADHKAYLWHNAYESLIKKPVEVS